MIDRVGSALRANLIWLMVCSAAIIASTIFGNDRINAVTANWMFALGSAAGCYTLARSAYLGNPEYDSVRWFVFVLAVGLAILGVESFFRGYVVLMDMSDWYVRWLSAPMNILKIADLAALLVVNANIQTRGRDTVLAKTVAKGIGLATVIYITMFFVARAILA